MSYEAGSSAPGAEGAASVPSPPAPVPSAQGQGPPAGAGSLADELGQWLQERRRELHADPELSWQEVRTTEKLVGWLRDAGLEPELLPDTTGLYVDIGSGPLVAGFRGDIDALPVTELTGLPYASRHDGVAHSCGHDIHTTVMLGLAVGLHRRQQAAAALGHEPQGRIRVIFQPAEETMPGGAQEVIRQGLLASLPRVFALHCDPRLELGHVGTRIGAITSAADVVKVEVAGHGGHTSRPHLTEDVVSALGHLATTVPAVLSRRIDVRSVVSLVWGHIQAGSAHNAIPSVGQLTGTMRVLDADAWRTAGDMVTEVIEQVAAPFGVDVSVEHVRGVPPVINAERETMLIEAASREVLGEDSVILAEQSMGGEDFAWMTNEIPGAMFRLGTKTPGGEDFDLHRGDYAPDERAVEAGTAVMLSIALRVLAEHHAEGSLSADTDDTDRPH
jgi:amidohydrolase